MANKPVRGIAFDCYGTLVDFADEGFISAYDEVCRLQGLACSGRQLWDEWMEVWRQMAREGRVGENPPRGSLRLSDMNRLRPLDGPVPSFRTYGQDWPHHFATTFRNLGVQGDPEAAYRHVKTRLCEAPAFPEASDVVDALRPHFRLAIMSNADDDFLLPCLARNGLDFEVVVSSERVRAYKPHRAIFEAAAKALALQPEGVLYVGDSHFADVLGAKNAGMRMAWVNRAGAELPEDIPRPDYEVQSLGALLPLIKERAR